MTKIHQWRAGAVRVQKVDDGNEEKVLTGVYILYILYIYSNYEENHGYPD